MKQMTMALLSILVMGFPVNAFAGSLDSPSAPGSTSSYTLEDIYNRLNTGAAATQSTFAEPTAGPGSTGHTLNEVYDLTNERAFVPKTGQTSCWDASGNPISCAGTGQDGEYQEGVSSPTPRFKNNWDGTVTDNLTGLIWLKDGTCSGNMTWADALTFCDNLANGKCGLLDGSSPGDWRLPNRKELLSLIDLGQSNPAMPAGHPFTVISIWYWSSSSSATTPGYAWDVYFYNGNVDYNDKSSSSLVRAVRAGQ